MLNGQGGRGRTGDWREDDVIATPAGVADAKLLAANGPGGALGQPGEGANDRIDAIVLDDGKGVAQPGGEVERGVKEDVGKRNGAMNIELAVPRARSRPVQLDLQSPARAGAIAGGDCDDIAARQNARAVAWSQHVPNSAVEVNFADGPRTLEASVVHHHQAGRLAAVHLQRAPVNYRFAGVGVAAC